MDKLVTGIGYNNFFVPKEEEAVVPAVDVEPIQAEEEWGDGGAEEDVDPVAAAAPAWYEVDYNKEKKKKKKSKKNKDKAV